MPLGEPVDLAEVGGLPWSTIATLHSGDEILHRVVGPAISQTSGWVLPVLYGFPDPTTGLNEYKQQALKLRIERGLETVFSQKVPLE